MRTVNLHPPQQALAPQATQEAPDAQTAVHARCHRVEQAGHTKNCGSDLKGEHKRDIKVSCCAGFARATLEQASRAGRCADLLESKHKRNVKVGRQAGCACTALKRAGHPQSVRGNSSIARACTALEEARYIQHPGRTLYTKSVTPVQHSKQTGTPKTLPKTIHEASYPSGASSPRNSDKAILEEAICSSRTSSTTSFLQP